MEKPKNKKGADIIATIHALLDESAGHAAPHYLLTNQEMRRRFNKKEGHPQPQVLLEDATCYGLGS